MRHLFFLFFLSRIVDAQVQVDVSANVTYLERCDFWGRDFEFKGGRVVRLYHVRDSTTCGLICLLAPEYRYICFLDVSCTHFTWTNEHGCLPKHAKTKQEALETKKWHSYAKCGMVESRFSSGPTSGDEGTTIVAGTTEQVSSTDATTEVSTTTNEPLPQSATDGETVSEGTETVGGDTTLGETSAIEAETGGLGSEATPITPQE